MPSLLAVRQGSRTPSLLHLPADRQTNRAEEVIDLASVAGLELDGWQQDAITGASWRSSSGRWSSFENVVEVPRQNGKGGVLRARQLGGLYVYGERLQIHTAHEFKTCYEHFRLVVDLIESSPVLSRELAPRIGIRTGAGDQAIELRNGNRIRFLARSRTSGRGFSADVVYLDESFELGDETMGALLPTLAARPDPQIWYTSSAPHDNSTVLHRLRRRAQSGDGPRLFYTGWTNDSTVASDDPEAIYRANPALGIRINADDLDSMRRTLSDEEWRREHLGIAEDPADAGGVIPFDVWSSRCLPVVETNGPTVLSVDCPPERRSATIVAADTHGNIEVLESGEGVGWALERVVELAAKVSGTVAIDATGPLAGWVPLLESRDVPVMSLGGGDITLACSAFVDAVTEGKVQVRSSAALNAAIIAARRQVSGDRWRFVRAKSTGDISPLMAAVIAHWAASSRPPSAFFAY